MKPRPQQHLSGAPTDLICGCFPIVMMKLRNAIESTCSVKPKIFAIWPFTEKFGASWSHVLQMKKLRLRETKWLAYCCMGIRGTSTRSPYPPPIHPQLFLAPFKLSLQATHFRPRVIPGRVWMPHKGAWDASTVKLQAKGQEEALLSIPAEQK